MAKIQRIVKKRTNPNEIVSGHTLRVSTSDPDHPIESGGIISVWLRTPVEMPEDLFYMATNTFHHVKITSFTANGIAVQMDAAEFHSLGYIEFIGLEPVTFRSI